MNTSLIYCKTAKGVAELEAADITSPTVQQKVLSLVDGISTVRELTASMNNCNEQLFIDTLNELERQQLIHVCPGIDPELLAHQLSESIEELTREVSLPAIDVIELSPEESVQAWAEAQRGARALQEQGYYAATNTQHRIKTASIVDGIKVLVVEDDDISAKLLGFLLGEHGFSVERAADSDAAFARLQCAPLPDLILLDVVLPGLDGFEVLNRIRADAALRDLPVIMVTAKISDDNVMRGLQEGADGYIFKPFQWHTLYGCIKSVCGLED